MNSNRAYCLLECFLSYNERLCPLTFVTVSFLMNNPDHEKKKNNELQYQPMNLPRRLKGMDTVSFLEILVFLLIKKKTCNRLCDGLSCEFILMEELQV
jgi:hypothetical protein